NQLLAPFEGIESTRPFLYRFYDLAIRCFAESQQDTEDHSSLQRAIMNQLRYIRQSRCWVTKTNADRAALTEQRNVTQTAASQTAAAQNADANNTISDSAANQNRDDENHGTLFMFFTNQQDGTAIFLPGDNRPLERFTIPYTRQQLKEAGLSAKTLPLPEPLVKRLQEEREAGRNFDVSFSDTNCWSNSRDALGTDDWPFEQVYDYIW
ncbi:MAG: hypothetical protein ACRC2T_08815, partial [Thermoguttaceae bacterium]